MSPPQTEPISDWAAPLGPPQRAVSLARALVTSGGVASRRGPFSFRPSSERRSFLLRCPELPAEGRRDRRIRPGFALRSGGERQRQTWREVVGLRSRHAPRTPGTPAPPLFASPQNSPSAASGLASWSMRDSHLRPPRPTSYFLFPVRPRPFRLLRFGPAPHFLSWLKAPPPPWPH